MDDLITVVIPLYNKELSIQNTIFSVLNQTDQNFSIIVVNDGSNDNSVSVVQNILFDNQGRIVNQENAGEGAARNRGIKESQNDFIAFIDADDEWKPEFLESIRMLIEKYPDADVYGTSYLIKEKDGTIKVPKIYNYYDENWHGIIDNFLEIINYGHPFNSSSVVIRKKALVKCGGFPVGIKHGADVDTWIRLSFDSKLAFLNRPLSIYHRDAENRSVDLYGKTLEIYYPTRKLCEYIEKGFVPNQLIQSSYEYIAKEQLPLAHKYIVLGKHKKARIIILATKITKKYFLYKYYLLLCTFIPDNIMQLMIKLKKAMSAF